MYETYPKKSNSSVGEQKPKTWLSGSASPEYQQVGSKVSYKGSSHGPTSRNKSHEKTRAPFINGGGSAQVSLNPANKTHKNFPSESVSNKLVSHTSRPPQAR